MTLRADIVFDVPDSSPYYAPTLDAMCHAIAMTGADMEVRVV